MSTIRILIIGMLFFVILLFFGASCADIAPDVVPLDLLATSETDNPPGYDYPMINAVYPADGATGAAVDTKYVIVFNMPVDTATLSGNISISSASAGVLAEGADYSISPAPPGSTVTATVAFSYGGANPIPDTDTVTVTISDGIVDAETGSIQLYNPQSTNFTVGSTSDTTAPTISAISPLNGATGISLTAPSISIDFTETGEIDVASLNSSTFYLDGSIGVPCTYSYISAINRAVLTPEVYLEENAVHTVTVTSGVKDLSGNSLDLTAQGGSPYQWTFTTTATPYDPVPGNPSITDGPNIDSVGNTSAWISWSTNEPTDYTLNYGRGDDTPSNISAGNYYLFHSVQLNPPLTAGKRYYINVDYDDMAGNSGATSATIEFNTTTGETPTVIHNGAGDQESIYLLSDNDTGVFAIWMDNNSGNDHIYGQLYNSALAAQWNGGSPLPIYTEAGNDYAILSAVEDKAGGVIILASRNGSGIYAKRVDSAGGIVDWGVDADQATDTGLLIDAAGFNAYAVPVAGGYGEVIYIWEEAGPVIQRMARDIGSPPTVQLAEGNLDNGQNPVAITDNKERAYVVYEDTGNQIKIRRINADGNNAWSNNILNVDTQSVNNESIVKVISDNVVYPPIDNTGVIVLYSHNDDLYVQRMVTDRNIFFQAEGLREWGNNGRAVENTGIVTYDHDMVYDSGSDDVIVAARVNNDIWARRVANTSWETYISQDSGIQENPRIFLNGANTIIVWEDDRFVSNTGYGIFGMKIDVSDGSKNAAWRANSGGTDDYDGVAVILNNFQESSPNIRLLPYNSGAGAFLAWEDHRTSGEGSNLVYFNGLTAFTP